MVFIFFYIVSPIFSSIFTNRSTSISTICSRSFSSFMIVSTCFFQIFARYSIKPNCWSLFLKHLFPLKSFFFFFVLLKKTKNTVAILTQRIQILFGLLFHSSSNNFPSLIFFTFILSVAFFNCNLSITVNAAFFLIIFFICTAMCLCIFFCHLFFFKISLLTNRTSFLKVFHKSSVICA